jgi:hypothetical protein
MSPKWKILFIAICALGVAGAFIPAGWFPQTKEGRNAPSPVGSLDRSKPGSSSVALARSDIEPAPLLLPSATARRISTLFMSNRAVTLSSPAEQRRARQ